jgi:hypothetical protein
MDNNIYQIDIKDNILIFRTTSFSAGRGSFLHSGIYNRELASSLAAGAVILIVVFVIANNFRITFIHFVLAVLLFGALFLFFRRFIFRDLTLSAVFDKGGKIFIKKGLIGMKKDSYHLDDLLDIKVNRRTFAPENIDGVRLVEKVALQHGTLMPGFGEKVEFYTVELEFKDRKQITIFSSELPSDAYEVMWKLKEFLEIKNA